MWAPHHADAPLQHTGVSPHVRESENVHTLKQCIAIVWMVLDVTLDNKSCQFLVSDRVDNILGACELTNMIVRQTANKP
jgi:hypothetical protein